jgi:excisionase family DNA binding protein
MTVPHYYRPDEFAELMHMRSVRTVYRWIALHRIEAERIGGVWRIPASEYCGRCKGRRGCFACEWRKGSCSPP